MTILLHGTLDAHVFEAAHLPSSVESALCGPRLFGKGQFCSKINKLFCCSEELSKGINNTAGFTSLYATIDLEKTRVARTRLVKNDATRPWWNESFHLYCAHKVSNIIFTVKDDNAIGATLIGRAYLPVEEVIDGRVVDRWLYIMDEKHKPIRRNAKIHVRLQFFNVAQDLTRSPWIRSPNFDGVPYTFFKQRERCRVSLYQDAHVPENLIPKIPLSEGNFYEPHRCWEDVFDAITNAKHLIYISGWSVYTEISLVRDPRRPKPGGHITLGELLKKKATDGVRVLMLVWDDRTSVPLLKKDGLMATHDQETAKYFENTDVHCVLCPREPDDGRSVVQGLETSTMFTHHQKTLVVDSEVLSEGYMRMIVSFVGGIDLCDGRYDTPFHSLFRTLNAAHIDDFHQPNFSGASIEKGGPREPWHDIHCKLEGPIAWDVLYNFEQRWDKQGKKGLLVDVNSVGIISPTSTSMFPVDSESWNVQLFRSIDGGAANGFPQEPEKVARAGLVSGKNNIIERSIQDAYINAIRQAKNFIYIENQYFLGSSFSWKPDGIDVQEIGALHLIPKELSLKIVSKIEARERFTVYIVVPMWPEGVPESQSVQAILYWQKKTMEMMYSDINDALQANGLGADPKDYLSFFCLGNREAAKSGEYVPKESPEPDSDYARAQQSRRFMIYVHAKMMIVDDEYIIIGSANINQRSMDGARDTEIAVGAYQPAQLLGGEAGAARGQIYGFRMALWFEHLGEYDESYEWPESLECARKINSIAARNWEIYSKETVPNSDLPGHLLSYPINVSSKGAVTALGSGTFPDTKASVLGSKSTDLPPILTT